MAAAGDAELKVLDALDTAKTQGYHITAVIISGMGFFTDAYDLFCISLLTKLLGRLYYFDPATGEPGMLPVGVNAVVSGIALCGTLCGQLFFGWLGDRLGRKRVYGITSMIMVLFSLASGLSFGSSAKAVIGTLCFFRFWLGFGIGGDYPLSATIMSEYANTRTRGAFVAAVFAMQGVGILVAAVVTMATSAIFIAAFPAPSFEAGGAASAPREADYVWRIVFMLGCVPAALTYYWRMRMPETARYTALVAGNLDRAARDMSKVLQVDLVADIDLQKKESSIRIQIPAKQQPNFSILSAEFARRHGLHLFVTTTTWFLQAFAFYSQQLFQKDIYTQVGFLKPARTMSALQESLDTAKAQAIVALCGTVPGYWFTVALVDRIGRRPIQLLGFALMSAFLYALAVPYESYWRGERHDPVSGKYLGGHNVGFVVLFALTFFFANFGPNATTFIVPAEIFPARLRSTCHGLSAGVGKMGSILGAFGFVFLSQPSRVSQLPPGYHHPGMGMRNALVLLASASVLGFAISLLMPETKGKSLEELSGEAPRGAHDNAIHDNANASPSSLPITV